MLFEALPSTMEAPRMQAVTLDSASFLPGVPCPSPPGAAGPWPRPHLEVLVLLHKALIGQNLVDGDSLAAHPAQACGGQRTGDSLALGTQPRCSPLPRLTARVRQMGLGQAGHRRTAPAETRPSLPGRDARTCSFPRVGHVTWEGVAAALLSLSGQRVGCTVSHPSLPPAACF